MEDKIKNLQRIMTGAMIGLVRATDSYKQHTDRTKGLILLGIELMHSDDEMALKSHIAALRGEKFTIVPDCASCKSPCGRTFDYDLSGMEMESEGIRQRKEKLLHMLPGLEKKVKDKGPDDDPLFICILKVLFAVGENWDEELLDMVIKEAEEY